MSKEILSKYIDFQEEDTQQEVSRMKGFGMSIYYDGVEEGKEIGKEEGQRQKEISIIKSMHKNGISMDQIAKIVEMTIEEVTAILQQEMVEV